MGRRSAQTVLYHILNHLVRVLAPLMTFTAEEIFEAMPKDSAAAKIKSVHLADWLAVPDIWHNPSIDNRFKLFLELRPHVLKALEEKRRSGEIGGSLEAKVVFESASQRDIEYLTGLKKDLPGLLIVSQAEVHPMRNIEQGVGDSFSQTRINIARAEGFKCGRCWNFSVLVGKDQEHPALCERCVPVVKEWSDPSLAHSQGQDH